MGYTEEELDILDDIAFDLYGSDYDELSTYQKRRVRKKFEEEKEEENNISEETNQTFSSTTSTIKATIGRVGQNGSKTCILPFGSKVKDLIKQSGFVLSSKEKLIGESVGVVSENDVVVNNETYVIVWKFGSA